MSVNFELEAQPRKDVGKGASRRLRRNGLVPAILYGDNQEHVNLVFENRHLVKATESDAFYSHILTIQVEGKKHEVVLKALQRHPSKMQIMHLDLLRVNLKDKITMHVPIHFFNADKSLAIKAGGTVNHLLMDVEVSCLAQNLPEAFEIDLSELKLDHPLHLSDLKLPIGVEIPALQHGPDHDLPLVVIQKARASDKTYETAAS